MEEMLFLEALLVVAIVFLLWETAIRSKFVKILFVEAVFPTCFEMRSGYFILKQH